ncbi:hypothetical protein SSX86_023021 [Deinandra increscens subsp. villosa]|uniref:ATP-dependent DNA helicase n=1 Tax=Deinandra increscens subsp. villosa TaxID=3103831 RepID=A0AAP0CK36_9ASTR
MFVLHRFQLESFAYQEWPRHENYVLYAGDFKILIGEHTQLLPFTNDIPRRFRLYPLVPSLETLAHDKASLKLITDVLGKIIRHERRFQHFVLELQDVTDKTIQIFLYDPPEVLLVKAFRAMLDKSIVYISRVKLVRKHTMNFLKSTQYTKIVYEPDMPEAHHIRIMRITMVYLSDDIIVSEILTRAAAKVVGLSKSVCKQWYALLSTEDFAKKHCSLSLSSSNQRILKVGDLGCTVHTINIESCDYGPDTIVNLPFNDISIHASLDGLLLVCLEREFDMLLWNPVTRAYKNLSTPDFLGMYLNNHDGIGLYIDASEDYKVLHITRRRGVYGVHVYSRRVGSWRKIPFETRPEYTQPNFYWSSGTLCGDTLYFTLSGSYGNIVVMCFDVNLEQFKEISFPPVPCVGIYKGELLNVKEQLHMFVSTGYREMSIDLWKLEGEHWTKVFSFPQMMTMDQWCSMTHFMTNGNFQFTMTNGQLKDHNGASTSNASMSTEQRKEYNARYYAKRKENRQPQDRNVASTSNELTSAEKRKEYNARYYAKRRENNKVSKVGTNDLSESNSSPMTHERTTETQSTTDNITPRTTLPSVIDQVMPRISRGVPDGNVEEDPYNFVYNGIPRDHRVLNNRSPCPHCGAKRFTFEFPTFCCMSGKTMLANLEIPNELYQLFTSQDEIGKIFRHHIRAYNTNFAFASMGVTLDETMTNSRDGVYTFRAHKGIYHKIDQLVLRDGTPRYLQLYFYDPDTELDHRLQWPNLDRSITEMLTHILSTNPYVNTFRSLAELGPLDNYRVTLNASVELDQRVYNRPTTSEVAGIWVEGNDNITSYKRSIVVYGRSEYSQTIQPYFGCYDPLSYPLFFPNGEPGWHPNIPRQGASINEVHNNQDDNDEEMEEANTRRSRTTVAMREYYCYKFQIRSTENVLLFGGRLLQQFVVDVYIKIETSRLQFYELNQAKIRADLYQGIVDCVNVGEVNPNRVGRRIVLPASFIGGPRDMRRRFLDAMTIVQDDGKPDLFLTMTCNPGWPEITDNLKAGQTAQDRPELVSRVFRAKLEDLKEQLFKKHILGKVKSYVYVIEFQKRDGPGGTGKTYLYKALLAEVRSRGLIALATASSGAAANNMPGGRTAHSRFKIPINLENNSMCNINKQSGAAEVIRSSKIIIWDEASMAKRQAIEAVDRTLQDIIGVKLPFGGKIMVMGGDFRQVLPVIKRGTRAQIVDASLRMSPLWSLTRVMRLSINMRALNDPWFSDFLLRVGDGTEESIEGSFIRIPDDMTIPSAIRENSIKELIDAIFPSLQENMHSSDYIISRAILSTKNESVDEINDEMVEIFEGEEKIYYSFDEEIGKLGSEYVP